jgi:hypothetical protein
MQINPPFGYQKIVPFYRSTKVRLPEEGALPPFVRQTNAVPVSFTEFAVACRDYPLAFVTTDQGKSYSPVAIVGIAGNENLYVEAARWDPTVYLPAYVRRYPFCMARVTLDNQEQADRLVCVEESFVTESGEVLFDAAGNALPRWANVGKLLEEYERDLERTREMCGILADFGLLEPFALQAVLAGAEPVNLAGMYRVEEKRLETLNAAQQKTLIRKGVMGRIYAHLISLENFARLLNRKAIARAPAV